MIRRKAVWEFRSKLIQKGLEKELFEKFTSLLETHGLIANKGKIIDASFVEAPRQRNSREKNKEIKQGKTSRNNGSNIKVNVSDSFEGESSSGAHINYRGNPKTVKKNKSSGYEQVTRLV